ncbi:LLM class F420-dependent oxidoreductase [Mangrovihabitans endophyticus]|uniref:LLM class F420-dependent oxidoreductase n=1 Tax=Mangrovihabitans endophyticus TaxID=1751298 RepID=A0A8J3FMF4_9ACTN|nr:LLM class F420-dependent oxidoreductase [Mangrovihabitans endophyticus]GGK72802.1 LLM class F420-dependent oxidoreductase [Mangrovihabitans endophyticus]
MRFRIFTEPHRGADYSTLLTVAKAAEELGFDAFFRSDHYMSSGPVRELPGPTDAWITLAGLARETEHIRLGTLVSPATFRLPGPLAVSVAQVDQMSGGRIEFGFGAGWIEVEHAAYGIPFPGIGERFERCAEQLEIITGLWETPEGGRYSFAGKHYSVTDSPALPKPAQRPRPPIVVGGFGPLRTPRLAARFADEFNVPFRNVPETAAAFGRVRRACIAAGRDPASMVYSAAQVVCCGRDDAELAKRATAIGREPSELRRNGLGGSPAEIAERVAEYAGAGAGTMYLQVLDLTDIDHLELLSQLLPLTGADGE